MSRKNPSLTLFSLSKKLQELKSKNHRPKLLALYFSSYKTFAALSDPSMTYSLPLPPLKTGVSNPQNISSGILSLVRSYNTTAIVVGLPMNLDDSHNKMSNFIFAFVAKLAEERVFRNDFYFWNSVSAAKSVDLDAEGTFNGDDFGSKGPFRGGNEVKEDSRNNRLCSLVLEEFLRALKDHGMEIK